MTRSITYTALPNIPLVRPGDVICDIVVAGLQAANIALHSGDIIVIAQKIVSKSENRYVDLADVVPSDRADDLAAVIGKDARHIEVVLRESTEVLRYKKNVMIVAHRLGYVMANAGIDESNIAHDDDSNLVLLLPVNPDKSCAEIKQRLDAMFDVDIGVIINDSFGRAWRNGVVGVALGAAGLPSLQNLIGSQDLFGRRMNVTEVAIADELSAGASLMMGQGAEGLPVVHVRGFASSAPQNDASALVRPKNIDMFR